MAGAISSTEGGQGRIFPVCTVKTGNNSWLGCELMTQRKPIKGYSEIERGPWNRENRTYGLSGGRIPPTRLVSTSETYLDRRMKVMTPQAVGQDTFLDNMVGDTVQYIKENFGSAPLLTAYQGALDALEESNRRWKKYYEEEARLQSIFEGED